MNPILGIDYRPWKCYKCKGKYRGVYKLCHYWTEIGSWTQTKSLTKRTCYKCGYVRPILKIPQVCNNVVMFYAPKTIGVKNEETPVFYSYSLWSGLNFREIIPSNSFLGNCYKHGFF